MDLLTSWLARNDFLPHGYCITWSPGLLWTMVVADAAIASAYFSIPLAIVSFVRRRDEPATRPVAGLFVAFISACGLTHVMDVWTVWQPDYGPQALTKIVTAAISLTTAVALWRLIPKALKIPSVSELQASIASLEAEVGRRRSAEDRLVDIEQNLAVTLASFGAGFLALDRAGRVTRMNSVAEQLLGWPEIEAQGLSYWTVFEREERPPDDVLRNPVDLMIERGITVNVPRHVVAISRSGARTALEVKAAVTRGEDGSVRGIAMVFRDMTPLRRAEAEARRLAAIVESSSDAIIGNTLEGRITSWNGAAQAMFGYSAAEAIGQPVQILIPPELEAEEMRILAALAGGMNIPAFDTLRRIRDGRLLDVSLTISPVRDAEGRIIGAGVIVRDVSQQRRAEAALRDSQARLRFALEAAEIGDWDLDLRTGKATRSLRHDRCFGYDAPQPDWDLDIFARHLHPGDRDEVMRQYRAAIDARTDWHIECRVIWPDASVHWIVVQGRIQNADGQPARMLGIVTDITQKKLAEEARLRALRLETENQQIQEANRLKSLFLANMSHELRTPLNAIIGFTDLLRTGAVPPDSPKHPEFLGHVSTSARHLLHLINDVLDLSKVESGSFKFFPERVNLGTLVGEVGDVLHTALARKHMQIQTDLDPGLTDLVLDAARLKQVLYNYLSNAIKFTADGGRVTVRARAEGAAHFRIEVEDSGIGIAEADLQRLFIDFQQLDAGYGKQHAGTGLGLALTRRLVQAQGGSVGARSTPGVGSVFHLVLPRDPRAMASSRDEPSRHRLLVIEGDPEERDATVQALTDAGFQVDSAATGALAVVQASEQPYDALTLALRLPDENGLALLAKIRAHGASRDSPVVGLTMPAAPGQVARFPMADMLCKPLRSEQIASVMARFQGKQGQPAKITVIDDDPLALGLMHDTLGALGLATVCLRDGREALRDIEQHRPDAIVLALTMPDFDGLAVLDALSRLPAWCDTPVFVWTRMVLTDDEYDRLAGSARAILSQGGGGLAPMREALRRWRRPAATRAHLANEAS